MGNSAPYAKWIDDISRCDETSETVSELDHYPKEDWKDDEDFYGFHGLDQGNTFLYRVLSPSEDIKNRIACKDPNSDRTVEQHIASGSRKHSRFISTTLDRDVAANWAYYEMGTHKKKPRDEPLRIVKIKIQVLVGTQTEKLCINLCDRDVREHFIRGAIHINWVKSSKEVLFQYEIPEYVRRGNGISSRRSGSSSCYSGGDILFHYDGNYTDDDDDEELVYYIAEDIPMPPQPLEMRSLEEDMSKLCHQH